MTSHGEVAVLTPTDSGPDPLHSLQIDGFGTEARGELSIDLVTSGQLMIPVIHYQMSNTNSRPLQRLSVAVREKGLRPAES